MYKPTDDPPPYAPASSSRQLPPLPPQPIIYVQSPPPTPGTLTDRLILKTRHEPISGAFNIDPGLLAVPEPAPVWGFKRRRRSKKSTDSQPNATFETRQGDIALDLSVVGNGPNPTAIVEASTRQGDVNINVVTIQSGKHINLRITTRQGNICVFVPPTFRGPINLVTKRGSHTILPALSRNMQVITTSGREALVIVNGDLPSDSKLWVGDYLRVESRSGNIMLGLLGEDRKPEPQSLLKRLTAFFTGD